MGTRKKRIQKNRNRNNDSTLKDFMLFFNSIGIAVIITILCCNRCNPCQQMCGCCQPNPCEYRNGWEHRCPEEPIKETVTEIIRDTVYKQGKTEYITRYVPKYIYQLDTVYLYRNFRDTIYLWRTDTINVERNDYISNDTISDNIPEVKKSSHWSIYGGTGVVAHDLKPDTYTTPYYKFSYGVYVGTTYRFDNRLGINCEFDYTAPYQFLYNSQYAGLAGTVDYDLLKGEKDALLVGTGVEYDYSYNKRTFVIGDNTTSKYLTTNNMYIPIKLSYEHNFGDVGVGTYVRYRQNVIGQNLSHNYFLDGGIQVRYNFHK